MTDSSQMTDSSTNRLFEWDDFRFCKLMTTKKLAKNQNMAIWVLRENYVESIYKKYINDMSKNNLS